jgi:hypothetical protein
MSESNIENRIKHIHKRQLFAVTVDTACRNMHLYHMD